MFKALLVKEWKEKLPIAAFAAGLMVLFVVSFLAFRGDRDLRELIPAGFLIIFFPFLAVILGAGAFESEFRDGAWAFLLSRPVRKETIWLAKLIASASVLAAFCLAFWGLKAALPGLTDVIANLNRAQLFNFGIRFFPPVLMSSFFFFAVAFALSVLSERQFSLVFGSLFVGVALEGLMLFIMARLYERGLFYRSHRFLGPEVLWLALVLSTLAVLAASLVTFRRSDFSQPAKKSLALAKFSALFLVLAWIIAVAWPSIRPIAGDRFANVVSSSGNEAFISTSKGLYRYDISLNKLTRILRGSDGYYLLQVEGGDRVLYASDPTATKGPGLWTVKTDGTDKVCLAGGSADSSPYYWFDSCLVSSDGRQVIYLIRTTLAGAPSRWKNTLESVAIDGSGRTILPPLDPRLTAGEGHPADVYIRGWFDPGKTLLLSMTKKGVWSVWTYDLASGSQAKVFEAPPSSAIQSFSPNLVLWIPQQGPHPILELYDIATKETSEILTLAGWTPQARYQISDVAWSKNRDKVAFLVRQSDNDWTPAVYLVKERRLIMPGHNSFKEPQGGWISQQWLSGDRKLIVTEGRWLKILDQDLTIERAIAVPDFLGKLLSIRSCGGIVLITDHSRDAVWRLDLETETWKRIW